MQEPRVNVLPPETIGMKQNNKQADSNNKKDADLLTVFDKLFGIEVEDISNGLSPATKSKNDIVIGALRNILLVCEICKSKTRHMTPQTTTISPTTTLPTTTLPTTIPPTTTRGNPKALPNVTTLPPPGKLISLRI